MPPVFFDVLHPEDIISARKQSRSRNFDVGLARGVSRRCRYGFPQVLVCSPLRKGHPFPTTFWLSCPYLSRRADELESSGGVSRLGEMLREEKAEEWSIFNMEHALLRVFLLGPSRARLLKKDSPKIWDSLAGTGAGGIRKKTVFSVKCLHLQIASMLGMGWHPAGDWLMSRTGDIECSLPGEWPCAEQ